VLDRARTGFARVLAHYRPATPIPATRSPRR
jgi:hypothetical protein